MAKHRRSGSAAKTRKRRRVERPKNLSRRSARPRKTPTTPPARPQASPPPPLASPAPPPPPTPRPAAEAVALYERGLLALQQRHFEEAASHFRHLIEQYGEERELVDRARLYLRICERELEPPSPAPRSFDDHLYAATVALNAGRTEVAFSHLEAAAALQPDHDHLHYMFAVVFVSRQDSERALDHLRRAIELNPENRVLAAHDPDFEPLRAHPEFRRLVEPPAPPPALRRRGRSRVARPG
jgi:tetratricopeptide (TPR) repeat protein